MLNTKQQQTLADLKKVGLETPQQVIEWCQKKLTQIRMTHPRKPNQRRHSKAHYRGIIQFLKT
jgi:hypothetical protein